MTASEFLATQLDPGLAFAASLPGWNIPSDDHARLMLAAIPGQESNWTDRVQGGGGPAHSLFQMERGGMVTGVLNHPATKELAAEVCTMCFVTPDPVHVWGMMATEKGDRLAVAFARLGLWTDPHPLPAIGDEAGAWACYVRVWRPGAVSGGGERAVQARDRWHTVYQQALTAIQQSTHGAAA